jgi:pimeloyl-ACP methyl ester carboxylesterase
MHDIAALLDGVGPAHMVGQSYGAVVVLLAAGLRPERVRSLVAIEPPAFEVARGDADADATTTSLKPVFDRAHTLTAEEFVTDWARANGMPEERLATWIEGFGDQERRRPPPARPSARRRRSCLRRHRRPDPIDRDRPSAANRKRRSGRGTRPSESHCERRAGAGRRRGRAGRLRRFHSPEIRDRRQRADHERVSARSPANQLNSGEQHRLLVDDCGNGVERRKGLGLQLVQRMVEQGLRGHFALGARPGGGTRAEDVLVARSFESDPGGGGGMALPFGLLANPGTVILLLLGTVVLVAAMAGGTRG